MKRYELANRPEFMWPFKGFFADFDNVFREMVPAAAWNAPAVDIQESEEQYVVKADLPGYDKGEVEVHLENGVLTLSAQHTEETKEEKDGYLRQERSCHSFSRSFQFDKAVDADRVKADLKNGVLTIELPKSGDKPNGRRIELQ